MEILAVEIIKIIAGYDILVHTIRYFIPFNQ